MLWLCIRFPALTPEALAVNEREAIERLAAWAYQWSGWVSYRLGAKTAELAAGNSAEVVTPDTLLWLEIGASRALFGEPHTLLTHIDSELTGLGYSHCCALAPSPSGAALLTRLAEPCCVLTRSELRAQLASLSLSYLELPAQTLNALRCAGLRCIEEVLALPAAALARRFGPQCCDYLARLTGQSSDPRPAFRLPAVYRARCEFDAELHDSTALLFPLQRLLQEFQGYLRARDCAVQRFILQLTHRGTTAPVTEIVIGLATPAREAARFLLLARERLQSLALPAPVSALTLSADAFTAASVVQHDLFGGELQQFGQLSDLIDRLRARLGAQAVQTFQLQADHRPECAFARLPEALRVPSPSAAAPTAPAVPPRRPAALLEKPQRIEPPMVLLCGPERIESGWWDGREVRRDYYVARGARGEGLWVFQDHIEGGWYLQGLWV